MDSNYFFSFPTQELSIPIHTEQAKLILQPIDNPKPSDIVIDANILGEGMINVSGYIASREYIFSPPEIEKSAKDVLIRAIDGEIKDFEDDDLKKKLNEIEVYSFILTEATTNLAKNMNLLIREPINEKAIRDITFKVFAFYNKLKRLLSESNPEKIISLLVRATSDKLRKTAKEVFTEQESKQISLYTKLSRKFNDDPPNINDARMLSQAIYFKDKQIWGEDIKILICSTDHHFSKIREETELNDFVPLNIYRTFRIFCGWPDDILNILRNKKEIPYN